MPLASEAADIAPWPRSFIALAPDRATRETLAALPSMPASTPLHIDDLHLTLAFVGAMSDVQRHALAAALPGLACAIPELPATGIEAWPTPDRARVWVAAYVLPDALRDLVMRVQAVVAAAGLPVDSRPFRPHITLARFAKGGVRVDGVPPAVEQPARLEALALYTRASTPAGPRYVPLASTPLV